MCSKLKKIAKIMQFWNLCVKIILGTNMLEKNQIIEVEVESLGANGEGVAHFDGQAVFIPFALPNEKCRCQIINTKTKIAMAKVLEVIVPSADRVEPRCQYFKKCGGCDLQHLNYEKTLDFKTEQVQKNIKNIAKLDVCVLPCVSSKNYCYRNKTALPVVNVNGVTQIGMFREFSHALVETKTCEIAQPFFAPLVKIVGDYLSQNKILGFDEKSGTGLVKHLVARNVGDTLIVTLVVTDKNVPNLDELYVALDSEFKKVSLWLNINKKNNNVIFGDEFLCVRGEKKVYADMMGLKVTINPASFMQVNDEICAKIYSRVYDEIDAGAVVIDCYSGAGIMTGITHQKSRHSYGLEIVPQATADADILAKNNNLGHMTNINGDCAKTLTKLVRELDCEKINVVLDPPRKGCDQTVLDAVIKSGADKIIYISCNSATLSRDLAYIFEKTSDYCVKFIQPYDMFPQTRHCEVFTVLEKLK